MSVPKQAYLGSLSTNPYPPPPKALGPTAQHSSLAPQAPITQQEGLSGRRQFPLAPPLPLNFVQPFIWTPFTPHPDFFSFISFLLSPLWLTALSAHGPIFTRQPEFFSPLRGLVKCSPHAWLLPPSPTSLCFCLNSGRPVPQLHVMM